LVHQRAIEEEKNDRDILDQLEMSGGTSFGLMFLDHNVLGKRKED
jgi:ferritin